MMFIFNRRLCDDKFVIKQLCQAINMYISFNFINNTSRTTGFEIIIVLFSELLQDCKYVVYNLFHNKHCDCDLLHKQWDI